MRARDRAADTGRHAAGEPGLATPDDGPAGSDEPGPGHRFDAFLSYSSADRPQVLRIQRFLESYRLRLPNGERRRIKVYLDATDIRGGALTNELGEALAASRVLLLCCSAASTASEWVQFEVRRFLQDRRDAVIAPLLLSGDPDQSLLPQLKAMPELKDAEPRMHDLRSGWRLGLPRRAAKEELLRLLALLTGVELRVLRNWRARRTMMFAGAWTAGLLGIPATYLAWPVDHWTHVPLRLSTGAPLVPVACGFDGGEMWAASRVRELAGERPRNYIRSTTRVLTVPNDRVDARLIARERLLPLRVVDWGIQTRAAGAFGSESWAPARGRWPRAAACRPRARTGTSAPARPGPPSPSARARARAPRPSAAPATPPAAARCRGCAAT
jgi:hypothetical protein